MKHISIVAAAESPALGFNAANQTEESGKKTASLCLFPFSLKYLRPSSSWRGLVFLFVAFIAGLMATGSSNVAWARNGMTWAKDSHDFNLGTDRVGCWAGGTGCEPYIGDTACSTKLPILCLKKEGLANPGVATDFYHGWTGGRVGLTPPVAGSELTGIKDAGLLCEYILGPGYQIAEFHDGHDRNGGWSYSAYGNIADSSRFWTYQNDGGANCWGSGMGRPAQANALERILSSITCSSDSGICFSYELEAAGTESPDVTFTAELTATGKESVVKQEEYSDTDEGEFVSHRVKGGSISRCTDETVTEACLPNNCEIDYSRSYGKNMGGGDGYGVINYSYFTEKGGYHTHTLDKDKKCLTSKIKVCRGGWLGKGGSYQGYHVIYGKCTYTEKWSQQSLLKNSVTINGSSKEFMYLGKYDELVDSSKRVPNTVIVNDYGVRVVSKSPNEASVVAVMRSGGGDNAGNGPQLWAKTDYDIDWRAGKKGRAIIPKGTTHVDSLSAAPNNDTNYTLSIVYNGKFYTQTNGVVDTGNFTGWIDADGKFWVASVPPPLAIIDKISPNPAKFGDTIYFDGHGKQGPITGATWRTNRSQPSGSILNPPCLGTPCNFSSNTLVAGQHLIGFSVESKSLKSPEATRVLKINRAPLASITLIESTGKQYGNSVVTAVKWKDDDFDPFHDPIKFIGQAFDPNGSIIEYEWKSDQDGILSNQPSFSHNHLSLGRHEISFRAKDDNGEWSNVDTRSVKVIKPPTLLVHGLCSDAASWSEAVEFMEDASYEIETIDIEPDDAAFSVGASQIADKIQEMKKKYGVPKVNIVGHSMGGLNSRWYIQNHGYRDDVNKLVMIATPNHGSTLAAIMKWKDSGSHQAVVVLDPLALAAWFYGTKNDFCATNDLIPQSSALKTLNGNKKDEGYYGNESADNINAVYGNTPQYFNIGGKGLPSFSHIHQTPPWPVSILIKDIVLPTISLATDSAVHIRSAHLDHVPITQVSSVCHEDYKEMGVENPGIKLICLKGMKTHPDVLGKVLYFLGDDPLEVSPGGINEETDSTNALAGHVIYASKSGEPAVISAGETQQQQFIVDASINNLYVMAMGVAENGAKPSLRLLSPSGVAIDGNTALSMSNVEYDNETPIGATYHIMDVEPGSWTAIIESVNAIQYGLIVTGETNFWIGVEEGTQIKPGDPFTITAYAQKEGSGVSGLEVNATLVKTLDEGERIGGKYGSELRHVDPVTLPLTDLGDGRYELGYTDTVAPGVYRVLITAIDHSDPATDISRTVFTTFFVEYEYDLSIQSEDILFRNTTPEHHETIPVFAIVHNESGIEAKGVEVWFADGSLSNGGTVFAKQTIDNISANGSKMVSANWLATAGEHAIFVTVSPMNAFIEENLDNNTASNGIGVVNHPPVAYAGADQKAYFGGNIQANSNIFLDGSGSTDEYKDKLVYEWDINTSVDSSGDGIADNDVDLTGIHPVIAAGAYKKLGGYTVKLTVSDPSHSSDSDTLKIQLTNERDFEPPVANAGPDQVAALKAQIYFDGSASHDNYGVVPVWDINIDVDSNGDRIADNDVDLVGIQPVLPGGYPKNGVYTAKLTVTDVAGNDISTDTCIIKVINHSEIEFAGLKHFYGAGDTFTLKVAETPLSVPRTKRVDLWVAMQLPSGEFLFINSSPSRFFLKARPFKTGIKPSETVQQVFESEVMQVTGETYTFYAFYVERGRNPLVNDISTVLRSNIIAFYVRF